jgi:hypothetical protein
VNKLKGIVELVAESWKRKDEDGHQDKQDVVADRKCRDSDLLKTGQAKAFYEGSKSRFTGPPLTNSRVAWMQYKMNHIVPETPQPEWTVESMEVILLFQSLRSRTHCLRSSKL